MCFGVEGKLPYFDSGFGVKDELFAMLYRIQEQFCAIL